MDNTFFVRGFKGLTDLLGDSQRFFHRYGAALDPFRQRFSNDEFHYEELVSAGFFQAVNSCDLRMVQRCKHARFALETRQAVVVVTERFRNELDGNTAAKLRVSGLIHVSHATRTEMAGDLVMCEFGSDHGVRGALYQSSRIAQPF